MHVDPPAIRVVPPLTDVPTLSYTPPPLLLPRCHAQDALRTLEMPRFTRRYPAVLETLMKQMLNMVHVSGVDTV